MSSATPTPPPAIPTIESILSVPLDFILCGTETTTTPSTATTTQPSSLYTTPTTNSRKRQRTPSSSPSSPSHRNPNRQRRLLLRGESSTMIRIKLLAIEMDTITSTITQILHKSQQCRSMATALYHISQSTPTLSLKMAYPSFLYLRPLLSLLYVHGGASSTTTTEALRQLNHDMTGCLEELRRCSVMLRQFADQNWNVADQLEEMFGGGEGGGGNLLVREKRMVGEVEEALVDRIERLLGMATEDDDEDGEDGRILDETGGDGDDDDESVTASNGRFPLFDSRYVVSMDELCGRLLKEWESVRDESSSLKSAAAISNNGVNSCSSPLPPLLEVVDKSQSHGGDASVNSCSLSPKMTMTAQTPQTQESRGLFRRRRGDDDDGDDNGARAAPSSQSSVQVTRRKLGSQEMDNAVETKGGEVSQISQEDDDDDDNDGPVTSNSVDNAAAALADLASFVNGCK